MGKFDGVLLATDFDGTLFHHGTHAIPPRNLTAINYFISEGGTFTVATGRSMGTFAPFAPLVPFNAPVVLGNGSSIYNFSTEQFLINTVLPDTARDDLAQMMARFPTVAIEVYHNEAIFAHNPNAVTEAHMNLVHASYTETTVADLPTPITKAIVEYYHDTLCEVQQWFNDTFPNRYEAIFSTEYFLELTAHNSHKGAMVLRLAETLGIETQHIYCAGDNQNDISMLAVSAIPFAPSDCADSVKEWGATLLCTCEQGLMADIIDVLDARY